MKFYPKYKINSARKGYAVLIMTLLIIVFGALIWLDPFSLYSGDRNKNLPWNQEKHLVAESETVPSPKKQQPQFTKYMAIKAECQEDGKDRGKLEMVISSEGRVLGFWGADYRTAKGIRHEVVGSKVKGNIAPKLIYKDESGENPTKLYIISKGGFSILETNDEKGTVRKASGKLYITGWVDTEYNMTGKVTITSDMKRYFEYDFAGALVETPPVPFDMLDAPTFHGFPIPKVY